MNRREVQFATLGAVMLTTSWISYNYWFKSASDQYFHAAEEIDKQKRRIVTELGIEPESLFTAARALKLRTHYAEVGLLPFLDRNMPSSARVEKACEDLGNDSLRIQACNTARTAINRIPAYKLAVESSNIPALDAENREPGGRALWGLIFSISTATGGGYFSNPTAVRLVRASLSMSKAVLRRAA
jgi:hypothetical protein